MSKVTRPAVYAPKDEYKRLCEIQRASTGVCPNLTGMRAKYWGWNAPIVVCRRVAFLLNIGDYNSYANAYGGRR